MEVLKYRADKDSEWVVIQGVVGPKPVKGVDYFTETEQKELVDEVLQLVTDDITPNATATVVGGITVRVDGDTLYIRNDGEEA